MRHIGQFTPAAAMGHCVYCSHYQKLAIQAGACTDCGHCDERCPFQVKQGARMQEIADYFGF